MSGLKPRGSIKDFWNTVKSISITEIVAEANRPVSIALVGNAQHRAEAGKFLLQAAMDTESPALPFPEAAILHEFASTSEEDGYPRDASLYNLVFDMGGGHIDPPTGALVYSVDDLGGWQNTLKRVVEDNPTIELALARNFPAFRPYVAERIISLTATVNAQFSLVTGATAAFPLLGWLLPVNGLSDTLMLTKNQAMMTLRLAAAHGLSLDYKKRIKEVTPLLLNAFSWRELARQLVGIIPGAGFVMKAGIAYAGTITAGKAANAYYATGEKIDRAQIQRWYKEALEASKSKIQSLLSKTPKQKGSPPIVVEEAGQIPETPPRLALPPGDEDSPS